MAERLETRDHASPPASQEAEPTDEALEAAWKGGSTEAFAVLFQRYHARVFAFALKLTGDRHLAEDLAQRAFLNIYKKPPPGTGRASFKALLFTVARNEGLNELKRRGRRREGTLDAAPEPSDGATSPGELVDGKVEAARLRAALAQLPDGDREVVLLREAEGLTFREVCEVTGLTRDTVRWRLARGLEALRELLGVRGEDG
ncbi:MAG: RNA polymerase sigma factor [Planctomycetes bacterium]|nr:RNA polymerase sigma factor [Planctomycetota bacterium]